MPRTIRRKSTARRSSTRRSRAPRSSTPIASLALTQPHHIRLAAAALFNDCRKRWNTKELSAQQVRAMVGVLSLVRQAIQDTVIEERITAIEKRLGLVPNEDWETPETEQDFAQESEEEPGTRVSTKTHKDASLQRSKRNFYTRNAHKKARPTGRGVSRGRSQTAGDPDADPSALPERHRVGGRRQSPSHPTRPHPHHRPAHAGDTSAAHRPAAPEASAPMPQPEDSAAPSAADPGHRDQ